MASKRSTAETFRTPALDMATAAELSKEELLKVLEAAQEQGGLDAQVVNTIMSAQFTTRQKALQVANSEKLDLSPEQIEAYLQGFKKRFEAMPELHKDVTWSEVEKSLMADPEAIRKLLKLDIAGFAMNVFHSKDPAEIVFRTAQRDTTKIAAAYRTIMYDKKAQTDYPQYSVNGNAEDLAAETFGGELADPDLYEQLRLEQGWVWLKTDAETRKSGAAFLGDFRIISGYVAFIHDGLGSLCIALRVKKA